MSKLRMSLVGRALDCGPQVRVLHSELGSGPSPRYARDLLFFFLPFPRFPMTVAPPRVPKGPAGIGLELFTRSTRITTLKKNRASPWKDARGGGSRAVPFKMQNLRRDPSPMDERSKSTTGWNGSTGISFISSPEYPSSGRRTEIRFFQGEGRTLISETWGSSAAQRSGRARPAAAGGAAAAPVPLPLAKARAGWRKHVVCSHRCAPILAEERMGSGKDLRRFKRKDCRVRVIPEFISFFQNHPHPETPSRITFFIHPLRGPESPRYKPFPAPLRYRYGESHGIARPVYLYSTFFVSRKSSGLPTHFVALGSIGYHSFQCSMIDLRVMSGWFDSLDSSLPGIAIRGFGTIG
eukprot:Gb_17562 [translate_table: standard]